MNDFERFVGACLPLHHLLASYAPVELRHSVLANRSDISSTVLDCLSAAKASVANIHSATFKNHARHNLRSAHIEYWKSKLEPLTVQNKFLDIVTLEQAFPLWNSCPSCYVLVVTLYEPGQMEHHY